MTLPPPALAAALGALVLVGACRPAPDDASDAEDATTGAAADGDDDGAGDDESTGSEPPATEESAGADESSESTGGVPPVDCTDACADTQSEVGLATCYSCRCLNAFDGWLPAVEELQCANADPIVTYHADGPELVPIADDAASCANPSLLTGSCAAGSRLGQLQHGDIVVKWVCRDPYDDAGTRVYTDMGVIGHNLRTGATCYWDDVDDVTHDDDMPALDLRDADDDTRARFVEVFYHTEGETCVGCHDHDPFVYTPYLQSTGWVTTDHTKGAYGPMTLMGEPRSTGNKHLVSPQVAACTACHRMGSAASCTDFARDSMGMDKTLWYYETAVIDAAEPGSEHWQLAYWMPNGVRVPDFATWLTTYSGARDHLMACCANPGVDSAECMWADVPFAL